jgi:hypothetical protein
MACDTLSLDIHLLTFGDSTVISSSTDIRSCNVALNSHNRILIDQTPALIPRRNSPVNHHIYPEMGYVHSEHHHTIILLALYVTYCPKMMLFIDKTANGVLCDVVNRYYKLVLLLSEFFFAINVISLTPHLHP